MRNPEFWSKLLRYVPYWLGIVATGILTAQAMHLPIVAGDTSTGQLFSFVGAMLNLYGVHGVAQWNPPRETWTMQQKIDESRKRIARGEPPLYGFDWLLTTPAAAPSSPPPPLPPVDDDHTPATPRAAAPPVKAGDK